MKTLFHLSFARPGVLVAVLLAATALVARASVTMQLDRSEISEGDTAHLTVNASGNGSEAISPPVVPGLEFSAVNQSSQIEIINGATSATSSVTYEITAQAPGTYTIPSPDSSAQSLTLRVLADGSTAGGGPANSGGPVQTPPNPAPSGMGNNSNPGLPAPAVNAPAPGTPHMMANGAAFVRLDLPKHEVYVGENVPVDIQVGLRAGMRATLNGLPSLSADAFTLAKLSDKPEQTEEEINGEPYTMLTWHSVLAAVKPGDFSLQVETPVTVEIHTRGGGMPGMMDDPFFNNSFFQNFFGSVTQKDLDLKNDPDAVKVLPLPAEQQPPDFGGAVGQFSVRSEISPDSGTVGDPLTLRLTVKGTGSFDRVDSAMLGQLPGWKTYRPTEKFEPADSVGYRGEKKFEQAVIPEQPGHQTLPGISFSFFNPDSRRYETVQTAPVAVDIAPGANPAPPSGGPVVMPSVAAATPPPAPAPVDSNGLRPDEPETGASVRTLQPLYFQPGFLAGQGALALGFLAAGVFMRRRERLAADQGRIRRNRELKAADGFLAQMDAAARGGDAAGFFSFARQALQHSLAWRWGMAPGAVTVAEIDAHPNEGGENIRRVFALADEVAYAGGAAVEVDFPAWQKAVHQLVRQVESQ
jgi:hypothetical protein